MEQNTRNSEAVSPVVGVMLMLVVTIIIAAVVSAYAGGFSQGAVKTPQVTIGAEVRDSSSILISHDGGDSLDPASITIKTYIPSGTYKDMSYEVDLSKAINLETGDAVKGTYSSLVIKPGDKIKINWADAFATSKYGIMAPGVGEPVNVEIYDSGSGKVIAMVRTNVLP